MTRRINVTNADECFIATDNISKVVSQGKTLESALSNLKEALKNFFQDDTSYI